MDRRALLGDPFVSSFARAVVRPLLVLESFPTSSISYIVTFRHCWPSISSCLVGFHRILSTPSFCPRHRSALFIVVSSFGIPFSNPAVHNHIIFRIAITLNASFSLNINFANAISSAPAQDHFVQYFSLKTIIRFSPVSSTQARNIPPQLKSATTEHRPSSSSSPMIPPTTRVRYRSYADQPQLTYLRPRHSAPNVIRPIVVAHHQIRQSVEPLRRASGHEQSVQLRRLYVQRPSGERRRRCRFPTWRQLE